ncbi:hypothetical protein SAMN04487905_101207 [Actinopolyspora xinjiangensis]|uniref:DUF2637 domain-containing protein n=1 Tax=Actinopolyspora xinjiangensis TaxID=405564 RepID=A0A1H0NPM9_9ACTN|nr:hypothetical protein [Actinopolyspora xinjiangensis]SDO94603.1 hypothetical protein SAMN04487905_101207 [Actinopolyspora xinjiangensis]
MTQMSYRDPRAARTAAKAEAERARADAEAVRAETQRAAAEAVDERRRAQRAERAERVRWRRAERRQQLATMARWVGSHQIELLMSLIVVVPGLLAWSAMAAYGVEIYGPLGGVLPLFSEGAMWAFAFAVHLARRQGRPVGWLHVGVWTFAAVNATLNFLHGLDVSGVLVGVVMALVAVGGVVAHQLITAAPMRTRRSRADKDHARTQRIAHRRAVRMERAAVRHAIGELATDGSVRLRYAPGVVTLSRWGRRLRPAVVPGLVPRGSHQTEEPGTGEQLAAEITDWLSTAAHGLPGATEPAGTAKTRSHNGSESQSGTSEYLAEIRRAIASGELEPNPTRRRVQQHLGVRATTAQRVLRALRRNHGDGPSEVAA